MGPPDRYELAYRRLAPGSIHRYNDALQKFMEWVPKGQEIYHNSTELDQLLTDYIVHLYHSRKGQGKTLASHTRSALCFYIPSLRGALQLAKSSIQGWNVMVPNVQYRVCPRLVAYGIAFQFLKEGQLSYAVRTLVMFDGFLGSKETYDLLIADTSIQVSPSTTSGTLNLKKTKTGVNKSVLLRTPFIIQLMDRLIILRKQSGCHELDRVFAVTPAQFRKQLKRILENLGLEALKITPHALRYGAASEAAREGVPTEDIMTRGRWSTRKSLIRYMQPGLLVSQLHLVKPKKLPLYQRLVDDPYTFFNIDKPEN